MWNRFAELRSSAVGRGFYVLGSSPSESQYFLLVNSFPLGLAQYSGPVVSAGLSVEIAYVKATVAMRSGDWWVQDVYRAALNCLSSAME